MKIYVASSWRNIYQPEVVRICRALGHEVYDFRHPGPGENGFGWHQLDPRWKEWDFKKFRKCLKKPRAQHSFALDMNALREADACLMVYPCGRSASLELGFAVGAGKRTAVLFPTDIRYSTDAAAQREFGHSLSFDTPCAACRDDDGCWLPSKLQREFEPELMLMMANAILIGEAELRRWLG